MAYWASVLAALGWIYAGLASFWLHLFNRGIVKSGEREVWGYRIGLWKIYWRLPIHAAILVVLLSMIPLLAVIFFDGWVVTIILVVMTGILLALWMYSPPGTIIGFVQKGEKDGHILLEPSRHTDIARSLMIFTLLGLLPALGVGAVLNWMLTR